MMYALVDGNKVTATPGSHGICVSCERETVSKCGEIKTWHWAHETLCPFETEPETEWHLRMKRMFPADCVEIKCENHRADVIWKNCVYEFQKVPLAPSKMLEREEFWRSKGYEFMWVFYAFDCMENVILKPYDHPTAHSFRWKWPKRRLEDLRIPFVLDLGLQLLEVRKIHWNEKVGGWGHVRFINDLFSL